MTLNMDNDQILSDLITTEVRHAPSNPDSAVRSEDHRRRWSPDLTPASQRYPLTSTMPYRRLFESLERGKPSFHERLRLHSGVIGYGVLALLVIALGLFFGGW